MQDTNIVYKQVVTNFAHRWCSHCSPFFEIIDDDIGHIVEGGIFMRIMKRGFEKKKIDSVSRTDSNALAGTVVPSECLNDEPDETS
jgi:hypothetical protein